MPIRLALYQPDIAPNAGTLARLCACLGLELHIIEPAGFPVGDTGFRRAGMDYLDRAVIRRHASFPAFEAWRAEDAARLVLATTRAAIPYVAFRFAPSDVLLLGRESAGVPEEVHGAADARVLIPLAAGTRSLNVAVAGAMIAGEALRQLGGFPAAGAAG